MCFPYVYDDEDNVCLIEDRCGHNPTVYSDRATMKAWERGEPDPKPKKGCWCCTEYDGDRCHKEWNNDDDCYYIDWRDDKEPDEICDDFDLDEEMWRCGE